MDLSIIIVNYNSWLVLDDCISSIHNLETQLNIEIVVVDNQSTNDQFKFYQQKYPSVNWIKNSGNNGFANGCNLGANNATSNYLFFLNPDTRLQYNVLEHFLDIYQKEQIGVLTCLQNNNNGSYEKYNLLFPTPIRIFGVLRSLERNINKNRLKEQFKETATRSYPNWVSGSAVFISKQNLQRINGWNEDYWMYFEDVDLCKKADKIGLKCVVTKEVSLYHLHGGASRINPKTKAITKSEVMKSRHVYISNHFSKNSARFLQPLLFTNNILSVGLAALLSFPLFFIKKLQVNRYKFLELCNYYQSVVQTKLWLSQRSMNLKK